MTTIDWTVLGTRSRPWLLALALALLMACGGGGSDNETIEATAGTGSLGVTVGDNPAEDFDEILVTVTAASLIGGPQDGPFLLTDETFTFDLLALDAATELLLASDDVPAGDYSKIRLELESIELRRLDEDGELDGDPVQAVLLADGKLDLNPRGPFTIQDGGALIVQLDIDARRSFLAVETGVGDIRFRPVVFMTILGDGDLRRITFLSGDIQLLAAPEGDSAFDLCNARSLTGRGPGDRALGECRQVEVLEETAFFDTEAAPIEFAAVDDQSPAIVAGRVIAVDGVIGFESLMVQLGERSDFRRIRGTIADDAVDGEFQLVGGDAPEESGIAVTVQPNALLFDQDGEILEVSALVAGASVRAMGRFVDDGEAGNRLLATAIAVETTEPDEALEQVTGEITGITDGRLDLVLDDASEACVLVGAETEITVVESDGEGQTSRPGDLEDLEEGQTVDARGTTGDDGCLAAVDLVVETETAEES